MKAIDFNELPAAARKAVLAQTGRKRASARKTFTVEHERRYALRVLALVSDLSQAERARVLARATKANKA